MSTVADQKVRWNCTEVAGQWRPRIGSFRLTLTALAGGGLENLPHLVSFNRFRARQLENGIVG